jgi:hypothetical protein
MSLIGTGLLNNYCRNNDRKNKGPVFHLKCKETCTLYWGSSKIIKSKIDFIKGFTP